MKSKSKVDNSMLDKLFDKINYIGLTIFSIILLYPFYYCVMLSFNEGIDAQKGGIYFWPRKFTLQNFDLVFSDPGILSAARNSIVRTVVGAVICVFFTAMFAYAISRQDLIFQTVLYCSGLNYNVFRRRVYSHLLIDEKPSFVRQLFGIYLTKYLCHVFCHTYVGVF